MMMHLIILYIIKKKTTHCFEKQNVKEDQRDSVSKSSDNKSTKNLLLKCTFQDRYLRSKLSLSWKKVRFSKREFFASISISDIKYDHLGS